MKVDTLKVLRVLNAIAPVVRTAFRITAVVYLSSAVYKHFAKKYTKFEIEEVDDEDE